MKVISSPSEEKRKTKGRKPKNENDAEFADELGKPHHLKFKHFDPTKTADQVKTALTKLTKIGLFEKDGIALFK